FPSRRVRLETAGGRLRVRVPRCPDCRARLWLSLDGAQLVCRSCGTAFAATIEGGVTRFSGER
ncbi:MAG TPA: Trm112 family protein, partial [Phycisphaerae bacterium]|nr:Trm112 family protein [Phycisphaerae bacterium]